MLRPLMINGRPHWERRFPKSVWPAFTDFRNLLAITWDHMDLPAPTPAQYEVAHRLQFGVDSVELADIIANSELPEADIADDLMYGKPREDCVRAFRALGKSYVTSCYTMWRLLRNPRDEKVLVLSATDGKAKQFVHQTKQLITGMSICKWLLEGGLEGGGDRRDRTEEFDVQYASLSQSASVTAKGITGQITGNRATLIIPDDIEIRANTKTEDARAELLHRIQTDLGPIRKTEHGTGDCIFLGTPHSEESIYNKIVREMGYACYCIPVRWPAADKLDNYLLRHREGGGSTQILAHYLRRQAEEGKLKSGDLTDTRYSEDEVLRQEASGRSTFPMQFMLDTALSDSERYPLKQFDLIIMGVSKDKAPLTVQWGRDSASRNVITDIPNLGFSGDFMMRPLFTDPEWRPYDGKVLYADPAGRGKDEFAWAIVGHLAGTLYAIKVGAHRGDPGEALVRIARDALLHDVNVIELEPNWGQGMGMAALHPILLREATRLGVKRAVEEGNNALANKIAADPMAPLTIQEGEWSKGQKETRIIDWLEPVMTTHRLVISEEVLRADVKSACGDDEFYSLAYQLTHITRDARSLKHDDRLEALSGGVAHFQRAIEIDAQQAREGQLADEHQKKIDEYVAMAEGGFKIGRAQYGRRRKTATRDYSDYEPDELVVYRY